MKPEGRSHFAEALAGAMGSCFGATEVAAQVAAFKAAEQERIQVTWWCHCLGISFDTLDADQQDRMIELYWWAHA